MPSARTSGSGKKSTKPKYCYDAKSGKKRTLRRGVKGGYYYFTAKGNKAYCKDYTGESGTAQYDRHKMQPMPGPLGLLAHPDAPAPRKRRTSYAGIGKLFKEPVTRKKSTLKDTQAHARSIGIKLSVKVPVDGTRRLKTEAELMREMEAHPEGDVTFKMPPKKRVKKETAPPRVSLSSRRKHPRH